MKRTFTINPSVVLCVVLLAASLLPGCTAIQKWRLFGDLKVDTHLSDSIFLDPVSPEKRKIYIRINNTSGTPNISFGATLQNALQAKGYSITDDPQEATYWLQANIKYFGETDPNSLADLRSSSFGSTIEGAALGGVIGELVGGDDSTLLGAAIGGAASFITDMFMTKFSYTAVVDIQVSAKTTEEVRITDKQLVRQGESAISRERSTSTGNRKTYRTRVISTATELNLSRDEAVEALKKSLAATLSGIL